MRENQNNTNINRNSRDYEKVLSEIDLLMKKGERNLSKEEMETVQRLSGLIEEYENRNSMAPVQQTAALAKENDRDRIAAVLGYEPDLIGLVEFKMYQLKMNQNSLAEILRMPASKISQILNKKRDPDVPFLKGIHEKLGIDGNYILEAV